MTDMPPQDDTTRTDAASAPLRPASPVRRTAARAARASVSVIWAVPIIALLVTMALAWNAYTGRGTEISVAFNDATGITPGETELRFREIPVGRVEAVRFTPDLQRVIVDIRVDKDIAQFIDDEAEFWIVRPQVSAQGISRLDTVLTGAFIEGWWDNEPGTAELGVHEGLERAPLTRSNERGTWVQLAASDASGMSEGSPIFYRGLAVGQMQNLRLSEDEESVVADVFIEAPHDQQLTTTTVFWDTSGFSVSLGAQGISLNVSSLSSLLQGGAEFATLSSGGQPVQAGHVFQLQPDRQTAGNSLFAASPQDELRLTMLMTDAVRGLTEGADVQFQGLTVGRVTGLSVRVTEGPDGQLGQVLQDITLAVSPQRMGLPDDAGPEDALAFLAGGVEQGLRARVTGAGFLGTSLMVELVDLPDVPAARIVTNAEPYPIIPSAPPDLSDISTTAQGFMARIGNLRLEELLKSATDMMNSVTAITSSQDTRAIPESLRRTIDEANVTMTEIRSATQELRASGVVENVAGATATANEIAGKLNGVADRLPQIAENVETATDSIREVDFASLGASIQSAVDDIRGVLGTDAARSLPGRLGDAVDQLGSAAGDIGAIAADMREGRIAERVASFMDEASAAAAAVTEAAADVPEMVAEMEEAAIAVEEFDFAGISASATGLIEDLRAMLGSEDAEQLPRNLSDTLQAASALMNELREGGAAGNLNAALQSARRAADQIAQAASTLPGLSLRFQQLAARAEAVIAAYGDRGAFNTETVNTLRSLRRAAESFGSLASSIERNPRAFILGR
ncbi:intermembrane transport protein PqiB [Paracoccus sp. MC1862]|uniref:PqiB family protein n=1 Tax=Paracoccus sp. MC1862 TaxID=2760307 RepID=UPI0016001D24|nr:MlaD family protein [Paracoccus sp. MC1862]MBB1498521.1 MCE family protein [Paracoccus sp. MC1862]QQO43869.1 MCE family protein [Paracoccus sp. MC1862]